MKEFKYLERLIVEEINHRIAQSFTILCFSWLAILVWKRKVCMVYQSIMLGMYGAETLAPTQIIVRKLETFHHHCVKCIIGIGTTVQWAQHTWYHHAQEMFMETDYYKRSR